MQQGTRARFAVRTREEEGRDRPRLRAVLDNWLADRKRLVLDDRDDPAQHAAALTRSIERAEELAPSAQLAAPPTSVPPQMLWYYEHHHRHCRHHPAFVIRMK
jgi:hypothetical protein